MVYVQVADTERFLAGLRERGVLAMAPVSHTIRVVFHLHIDNDGLERAIAAFRKTAESFAA